MSNRKKLIAVRIFRRRQVTLAKPKASRPTTTNLEPGWVSNAQNVARLAATSHHLPHIPSIRGIADVFTEMLGQIQKLKGNKDDFRDIIIEIADLINIIIKYAKEHESTPQPQVLLEVYDDFLRIVSSLETKMRQSIRISQNRFAGVLSYRDILYPFHVQIASSRRNFEAITTANMSLSTGFFAGAKSIAIGNSVFTEVHGNQIINPSPGRIIPDWAFFLIRR